jgi:integrase/recombinase XerD
VDPGPRRAAHPVHEQLATTNIYLHADISHKQEAIDRVTPLAAKPGRYRPPDSLIAFV